MFETEREQIAVQCRRLAAAGYVERASGNMSVRAGDHIVATAAGTELASITADEVVVCGLDGALIAGDRAPTSEIAMHVAIYRGESAGAIVHTHAPFATALACVVDLVPAVHYEMVALGGAVPVVVYSTAGGAELAAATARSLADRRAALLANHGAVTTGADLGEAVAHMELLEWSCALYWRACQLGAPRTLRDEQLEAFAAAAAARPAG